MGSLYVKGAKLWARYKDEHGVWKGAPTPYRPGDEANARRFVKTLEAASEAKSSFRRRTTGERKGRRDLLETITHGPRGNIINVSTTFPWPALCAEVAKLRMTKVRTGVAKIGSKSESARPVLDGEPRSLATGLATAQLAESLAKECDPSGIRTVPRRFDVNRGTTRTCIES